MVYPSMVGEKYPLFYKWKDMDDFIRVIESALDNPKLYNKASKHCGDVAKKMMWLKSVRGWMDWESFLDPTTFPMILSETDRYKVFVNDIKKAGKIDKTQLVQNWGVQLKFSRYRNRMRLDKRIKFTKDGYEWVG